MGNQTARKEIGKNQKKRKEYENNEIIDNLLLRHVFDDSMW